MTIINIRGTSGSGKSTLVHRFLAEHPHDEIIMKLGDWKNPRVAAYRVWTGGDIPTYVIGRYATACGGCDSMSYKGSHEDMEKMIRAFAKTGSNVIFEGLTVSSTITRWLGVSQTFPGKMTWAFMNTPEEECYQRILARSGREPKRDNRGLADYNRKHRGCIVQRQKLLDLGEKVIDISSDDEGYEKILEVLNASA